MDIQIGACAPFTDAEFIHSIGAKNIESGFATYAQMSDEDFERELAALVATPLRCVSMNGMIPGGYSLYGDDKQTEEVCAFVRRGMERAAKVGCKSVCFGSGGARNIPTGMTREEASERLASITARFCAIAAEYGIKIAIEPLFTKATNFIHTLADAYDIIRRLPACDNLGINVDMFHMCDANEDFSELIKYKSYVFNVHLSEPGSLRFPHAGSEHEQTYLRFFTALKQAGYEGNVSIEALTDDFEADVTEGIAYLNSLAATI